MDFYREYFTVKIRLIIFILLIPYYNLIDNIAKRWHNRVEVKDCRGKVAVITGGDGGIGSCVTRKLLASGMHVIIGCLNPEDGNKLIASLRSEGITQGQTTILALDLASLESVREFATSVRKTTSVLHYVINIAGILAFRYKDTEDNFESSWQVNYLGHFLLIHLLLPTLLATPGKPVIVNVSSAVHTAALGVNYKYLMKRQHYDGFAAYSVSKLALLMFTLYLNQQLASVNSSVQVMAVHPGMVSTEILGHTKIIENSYLDNPVTKTVIYLCSLAIKSPEEGAQPILYAAFHAAGGQYIDNCMARQPSTISRNKNAQQQLFEQSKQSLNINIYGGII